MSNIYMNWGGTTPPEIKGDVTAAGHVGWIEISSIQLGRSKAAAADPDGRVALSEIVITKDADMASHPLFNASLYGEGKKVVIDFVKDDNGKPNVYLSLTLTGAQVSGWSGSGSGDRPMENLSLTFTGATYGYSAGVQPHPLQHQNPAFWNIRPPAR